MPDCKLASHVSSRSPTDRSGAAGAIDAVQYRFPIDVLPLTEYATCYE
jgi:hypothetical protein